MKTIVISGAHSNVGKTTLAGELYDLIPDSVFVKIGHGIEKQNYDNIFYHTGTPFSHIADQHKNAGYLIIESNKIINEITPDCIIYLTGESAKPTASAAIEKADIIRGTRISEDKIVVLSKKLNLPIKIVRKIIWLSGARPCSASAIILAGGESKRMGSDKAFLKIDGQNIIKRLYNLLLPFFDEIIVSTSSVKNMPFPDVKIVRDNADGHGPLMGIYSSLQASSSKVNFITACDIPEINFPLMSKLLSLSEEYDVCVPSFKDNQVEPLFAVYTKNVCAPAKKMLDMYKRRVASIFDKCKVKRVSLRDNSWYANLNTPDDYKQYTINDRKVSI